MNNDEQQIKDELAELTGKVSNPDAYKSPEFPAWQKRIQKLESLVSLFDHKQGVTAKIAEANKMLDDAEMKELAQSEIDENTVKLNKLEEQIDEALIEPDPNDDKNVIVEIRAGAGGDEASLFAGELYRMYIRYAETHNLATALLSESPSEVGGFKEVVFSVRGEAAYSKLKFESGVHRVQRIPSTESQGRIHTSTATVAVMPEAEDKDVQIDQADLKIDTFRASGHGGQSVNTTDSAVRITHLPSGIVVSMQDEKSQIKNRDKAMSVLRSRLLAYELEKQQSVEAEARRKLIGSGDRSEKIRTYNFPQDRITDHRIGFSRSNLPGALDGAIDDLIDSLRTEERKMLKSS